MVTLEFYDPSGTLEVTQQHAPRLASLEGRRIGFVSNEQWLQAHSPRVIGRVMRVPESFNRLLADADRDLGCGSDACLI